MSPAKVEFRTTEWAFSQYEAVRASLPSARFPDHTVLVNSLADLADDFDVFLLDAFGVLNIGETAIAGAPGAIAALQDAGKRVMVLSNGASNTTKQAQAKYLRLGFHFARRDVVSSRDALSRALPGKDAGIWGVMAPAVSDLSALPVQTGILGFERRDYDAACGFLLLSTTSWHERQQDLLQHSLAQNPRPVLVGNPDIVAPREDGLSLEPGYFAHQLAAQSGIAPVFFGKPFGNVYDLTFSRLGRVEKSRVLMVGDSLHTDILGGAAHGIKTALVTDHGLFASNSTVARYIERSGIRPDYILPSP